MISSNWVPLRTGVVLAWRGSPVVREYIPRQLWKVNDACLSRLRIAQVSRLFSGKDTFPSDMTPRELDDPLASWVGQLVSGTL